MPGKKKPCKCRRGQLEGEEPQADTRSPQTLKIGVNLEHVKDQMFLHRDLTKGSEDAMKWQSSLETLKSSRAAWSVVA